jgi:hypothetical protein
MTTFLAILTGGGLAALGGLLSGLVTNWLGDKRDRRKYEHERAMALEARRQERLEQSYIELLGFLSHYAEWMGSVRRLLGQQVPLPDPPPREELNRVMVLLEAYGSQEVRRRLGEWRSCAEKLQAFDAGLPLVPLHDEADAEAEAWARDPIKLKAAQREAALKADKAIRDRIRQELAGEV